MKIIYENNDAKYFHHYNRDIKTNTDTYYCDKTKVEPITYVRAICQTVHIELADKILCTWKENESLYIHENGDYNEVYKNMPDLSKVQYQVWVNTKTREITNINIANYITHGIEYSNAKLTTIDNKVYLTADILMTFEDLICPQCGANNVVFNYYYNHSRLTGEYLFNNENSIKYTKMYKEYLKLRNGEIHTRYFKDMHVFNKTTGRIYAISNMHIGGSGVFVNRKSKIENITYENILQKELSEAIHAHYEMTEPQEYKYTIDDLANLISNNESHKYAIPVMYIKKYLSIRNTALASFLYDMIKYDGAIVRELKGKNEKEMLMYLKIAYKDIIKYFHERQEDSDIYIYCATFRYINKDYAKQILLNNKYRGYYLTRLPALKRENFIHQYAKCNGEKKLFNQLNKVEQSCLIDSINMYRQIKQINRSYELNFNNNIETIHDILSKGFSTASTPNKKIAENKELKAIFKDFVHNGISYRLAKTTHELIDVGNAMNICVGSYSHDALKKKCFIVVGYDTDNNPVTCIEINKHKGNFYISQAKKKRNQRPDAEERQALISLCNENNIEVKSYDLNVSSAYQALEQLYDNNEHEEFQELYF